MCHYHENWVKTEMAVNSDGNHADYFELQINKPTDLYLQVFQKSIHMNESQHVEYQSLELFSAKVSNNFFFASSKLLQNIVLFTFRFC